MKSLDISTKACPSAVILVDDDDWEFVKALSWTPAKHGNTMYAVTAHTRLGRSRLHRQIMRVRMTEDVDHINGNGLDCRKENLRIVSKSQNDCNRHKVASNTGYLGVHKIRGTEIYLVSVSFEKKKHYVGRYRDVIEAAKARDVAARAIQGDYVSLNFPELPPR